MFLSRRPRRDPLAEDKERVAVDKERLRWLVGVQRKEPLAGLPWTPTITCETADSTLMDRFDWVMMPESVFTLTAGCAIVTEATPWVDRRRVPDPKTVWAAPHAMRRLLDAAATHFDPGRADRVVLFSGLELPASSAFGATEAERKEMVAQLRRYFRRIVYQTKDIDHEHVHIAPMGLSFGYFMLVIGEWTNEQFGDEAASRVDARLVAFGEQLSSASIENKTRNILAAWGKVASWLDRSTCIEPLLSYEAMGQGYPNSNSSLRAVETAHQSRRQLRAWALSPLGRAAGVERGMLGPSNWWTEMARSRFLASPSGSGIQTAKNIEALLVLTVPIVKRPEGFTAFEELVDLGFPIVLVDWWHEVTINRTAAWWAALSPRLQSFRRNCLTADGFWRIYTGEVSRCE